MIKREQNNVQRDDISLGRDALGRTLWRLSLVLREIAAMDDQAEKPKNIEKKETPRQAPEENVSTSGADEGRQHKAE